ncbi:MAG: hypothetical protein QOJ15_2270, partial [Bradyrhizobium sp.]|nr:hypothetical protein [Bradyrhizobium sp.]
EPLAVARIDIGHATIEHGGELLLIRHPRLDRLFQILDSQTITLTADIAQIDVSAPLFHVDRY